MKATLCNFGVVRAMLIYHAHISVSAIISCIHGDAKISITSDGHYSVSVNAQKWLDSAHTFFQVNGQKYTTLFGNLKIANVSSSSGKDVLGNWCSTDFMFVADSTRILGKIKEYADYPLVVFEQVTCLYI